MANEQSGAKIDVRVYPINEPKGSTVAFASATVNGIGINGIQVVDGSNGLFARMPQTKDKDGEYRDVAFPTTKELRNELNKAILDGYAAQKNAPEKASVKDQIKDGGKDAPAKPTPDKAAGKGSKSTKKTDPEH